MARSEKLSACIVGAGRMGRALLASLPRELIGVTHIYRRSGGKKPSGAGDVEDWLAFPAVPQTTDIIFLAVPDAAIHQVSNLLDHHREVIVVHHSGAGALELIGERCARKGVLWPIQSLDSEAPSLDDIPLIYDGSDEGVKTILHALCAKMSAVSHCCDLDRRRRLHMGAVLSNNFSHHLLEITTKICDEMGLDAGEMYGPIMSDLLQDFVAGRLYGQQTGPAVRRDQATMESHLAMLDDEALTSLYQVISQSIIKRNP